MAVYKVQGPDGAIHRFEGPDDATPEQVTSAAEQQFGSMKNASQEKSNGFSLPNPIDAVKQMYDAGKGAVSTAYNSITAPAVTGVNRGFYTGVIGMPGNFAANVVDLGKAALATPWIATNNVPPESLQLRPRENTALTTEWLDRKIHDAGMGNAIDNPNPQSMSSRLIHGTASALPYSALNPSIGAKDLVMTAASGLAGSVASEIDPRYAPLASMLPQAVMTAGNALAKTNKGQKYIQQKQNERAAIDQKKAVLNAAQEQGGVVPPADVNGKISTVKGLVNQGLQAWSGPAATRQAANSKNQAMTNRLIQEEIGADTSAPLNPDFIKNQLKSLESQKQAVRGAGTIRADDQFKADLNNVVAPYVKASKDFPTKQYDNLFDVAKSAAKTSFDADSAVEKIRLLRQEADAAYRSGNNQLGQVAKDTAKALEGVLERNLAARGGNLEKNQNYQRIFESYGGKGDIDNSLDISAKSKVFSDIAKSEGFTVNSDSRGKYLTLTKNFGKTGDGYPKDAIIKVRISDHSKTNQSTHFGEHDINIAPDDGFSRHTFKEAISKLKSANVNDDLDTVFIKKQIDSDKNITSSREDAAKMLQEFRNARMEQAKLYQVDKAMNQTTGEIDPRKFAAATQAKKPMTGNFKVVGDFANAYPKYNQPTPTTPSGFSNLDAAGAAAALAASSANPTGAAKFMAYILGRPLARSVLLSEPYQKIMAQPSYNDSMARALESFGNVKNTSLTPAQAAYAAQLLNANNQAQ